MYQQQNQMRQPRMPDQPPSVGVVKLNEEQIAKLNSELDVVEGNVNVLNEILNELQHGGNSKADEDDLTLLKVSKLFQLTSVPLFILTLNYLLIY